MTHPVAVISDTGRLTGTVGVLLVAKERGLLDRIGPELERLQTFGFRLAAPVVRAVLERAGETD
ncbi:DUF3368 domain-containing protein [Sorangium sp. So ce315]|uniref:DUF3368 domain-containing protein n=1 Tax=Sorangium sp. So ce315 TaxID=3133299 RepID=UPI003F5E97C7